MLFGFMISVQYVQSSPKLIEVSNSNSTLTKATKLKLYEIERKTQDLFNREFWTFNYSLPDMVRGKVIEDVSKLIQSEVMDSSGFHSGLRMRSHIPEETILQKVISNSFFLKGLEVAVKDSAFNLLDQYFIHYSASHFSSGPKEELPLQPNRSFIVLFIISNNGVLIEIETRDGMVELSPKDFSILVVQSPGAHFTIPRVKNGAELTAVEMILSSRYLL